MSAQAVPRPSSTTFPSRVLLSSDSAPSCGGELCLASGELASILPSCPASPRSSRPWRAHWWPRSFLTWEVHDVHLDPRLPQRTQPLLEGPPPVEIQAGGIDPQNCVWVIPFEFSQLPGTVRAGAPGEVAGDGRLAQLHGAHLIEEEDFCMLLAFLRGVRGKNKSKGRSQTFPNVLPSIGRTPLSVFSH